MGTTYGTAGNDTINVSTWNATWSVYGYGGNDTITISNSSISSVIISGGADNDIINVPFAQSASVHGDDGDDRITLDGATTAGARYIYGDGGKDEIKGSDSADYIFGGSGNDTIWGRLGADHIYGDDGNDTIIANMAYHPVFYDGGADQDTLLIYPSSSYFWYEVNIATMSGIERIENTDPGKLAYLVGNALNLDDVTLIDINGVKGNNGDNYLRAGESQYASGNMLRMTLDGLGGNDALRGAANPDLIIGGAGNDRLDGFGGNDELNGGTGSDQFHFYEGWDVDTIKDFTQGEDLIYLHKTGLVDISSINLTIQNDSDLNIKIGSIEFLIENGASMTLTDSDFVFTETIPYI
ncbi:hypothetical protein V5F38_03510 [Xanthobacter sp. V0B-10]|uniref:calcium-binding protein n=1 Tax=Xanthobacter albus TaxID=3119929 RepID=UPI00372C2F36